MPFSALRVPPGGRLQSHLQGHPAHPQPTVQHADSVSSWEGRGRAQRPRAAARVDASAQKELENRLERCVRACVCVHTCVYTLALICVHMCTTTRHSQDSLETSSGGSKVDQAVLLSPFTDQALAERCSGLPGVTSPVSGRAACGNRPVAPRPLPFPSRKEHLRCTALNRTLAA